VSRQQLELDDFDLDIWFTRHYTIKVKVRSQSQAEMSSATAGMADHGVAGVENK